MIDTGPQGPRGLHRFVSFKLNFISAVDHPAQAPARALMVAKRTDTSSPKNSETTMDPTQQLATITKRLADVLSLSADQFNHFRQLPEAGQDAFLAMTDAVRSAEVQKALEADPVVVDLGEGLVVRKSAGATNIAIATMALNAKKAQAAAEELAQAQVYKARAREELGHLPLSEAEGISLLTAVDTIKNDEHRAKALAALKAQNVAISKAGKVAGVTGGSVRKTSNGQTAGQLYVSAVHKYAKDKNLSMSAAYAEFENTEEGRALKAEHDEEQLERAAASAQ